ncbi:MAG: hypothetical protein AD742_00410 [Methylibium sp. NZG]|nr:MAG: hypothetical protein AD742_00410 [Methylibium sp. NZG]
MALCPVIEQLTTQRHARTAGVALWHWGSGIAAAELGPRVDRFAASLQRESARPGDSVAWCPGGPPAHVGTRLRVSRCGAGAGPLPPSATPQRLGGLVAYCGAARVSVDAPMRGAPAPPAPAGRVARCAVPGGPGGPPGSAWPAGRAGSPEPPTRAAGAPLNSF